jgi:hypothetical protein
VSTFGSNAYGENIYGGPTVWSDSVSEAASAADSTNAPAAYAGTISEAASAADVDDATGVFGASVSETGAATDTPDATSNYLAGLSVIEAGSAVDTPDGPTNYVAGLSVIEGGSYFGAGNFGAAQYSASTTDTPSAAAIIVASVSESAPVTDATNITQYYQAPLPVSPPGMRRSLRIR